jgi:hypothetical protein
MYFSSVSLFLRIVGLLARNSSRQSELPRPDFDPMSTQLSTNGEPKLFYHRPTRVTGFLSGLLQPQWFNRLRLESSSSMWAIFDNSWVNFSHFSEDIAHKQAQSSLSRDGIFAAYLRSRAIVCKRGQEGIDIAIPMLVLPIGCGLETVVNKSHISVIILQIKNKKADSCDFKKFNVTYIEDLDISPMKPYLGIWMSLSTSMEDLTIEGGKPIKGKLRGTTEPPDRFRSQLPSGKENFVHGTAEIRPFFDLPSYRDAKTP